MSVPPDEPAGGGSQHPGLQSHGRRALPRIVGHVGDGGQLRRRSQSAEGEGHCWLPQVREAGTIAYA
jgi:hypothetical protein